jgi:hypothetical protein
MSLQLSSIFFFFCPTGCFPPSDCKWPSLLCLILVCKKIAPVLATQNKIHRLSEVDEAQLTELEDHLEDVHMTRVVQQVSVLRLQLRPIKAQLRVQLTIHMVQVSNQLRNHFRRWNRLPLVDLQFC